MAEEKPPIPPPGETPELIPSDLKYEDGFNVKTVWAAIFVGIVMLPGAMYMGLVTGVGLGDAAQWVTVILFMEMARRTFTTLRVQEIYIIYAAAASIIAVSGAFGSGLHLFGGSFGLFIWEQYLIQHPLMRDLAPKIPDWVVPPISSGVYAMRTFFHPAWIKPIVLGLTVALMVQVNRYTMGYLLFRSTSDAERLPFPLAQISVGGTIALAESSSGKEGWRWRVFSIGAMIGVAFGLIYVVVPVVTSAISPQPIQLIPIPWYDLTRSIHALLPGALLGISTNLGFVFFGLVLPKEISFGQFVGSMIGCILVPPLLVWNGWLPDWKPGFTTIPTVIALQWDFWISFGVGIGLVFAWGGVIAMVRQMIRDRRERRAAGIEERRILRFPPPPEGRGDFSTFWCVVLWVASTLAVIGIVKYLIPDFPVWITALFGFVMTPLSSYITARMYGITGQHVGEPFPFVRELSFIMSQYRGVALWFAPVPLYNHGWEARHFKELELARVKYYSLVKLVALTTVLMLVFSFIYWSLIWKLGPIPSSVYPFAQKMWPLGVQTQYLWLSITDPDNPARDYFLERVLNLRLIGIGIIVAFRALGADSLDPAFGPLFLFHDRLVRFVAALRDSGFHRRVAAAAHVQ